MSSSNNPSSSKKRPLGETLSSKDVAAAADTKKPAKKSGNLSEKAGATHSVPESDDYYYDSAAQGDHYRLLPFQGDHKRAVSSVQFAPSRLTKNRGSSSNSNNSSPLTVLAASASADGSVKVWDLKQQESPAQETAKTSSKGSKSSKSSSSAAAAENKASSKTLSSAKAFLAFDTSNPTTLRSMAPYNTCLGHSRGINEVCWNPAAPLLATASDDKTVRIWDAVTADALLELRGHASFVFSVHQRHNMVVTGSFDETVKLWDLRSGDCVSTLPAHSDPVTAVSFNRDGTTVCSASHDGLIRLWDVATGECLKTIYAAGNPPVSCAKPSPNSKYVLAGTLDSTLRLWPVTLQGSHKCSKTYRDTTTTTTVSPMTGVGGPSHHPTTSSKYHVHSKYSVVADFACRGTEIVVGSETGHVVVYDLQSRRMKTAIKRHGDGVLAVSAHDRQPLLCSGGMTADKRVLFWAKPAMFGEEEPATKDDDKMQVD